MLTCCRFFFKTMSKLKDYTSAVVYSLLQLHFTSICNGQGEFQNCLWHTSFTQIESFFIILQHVEVFYNLFFLFIVSFLVHFVFSILFWHIPETTKLYFSFHVNILFRLQICSFFHKMIFAKNKIYIRNKCNNLFWIACFLYSCASPLFFLPIIFHDLVKQ